MNNLRNEWYTQELSDSESDSYHRPIEEEYSFYAAVKNGDMNYVRKNLENNNFTNPEGMGVLSKNPINNLRYHFIISVAMITRHCVEGGLELELAYRLSDFYILKSDSCNTTGAIVSLHKDMVLDFTGKMLSLKKNDIISKPIVLCTEYIYNHINDRITINELAEFTELSPSYLSRLFKQNLGISVSDYIREKKIEKAENLLRYSDISLIEISN
ncbi:MAG: helix-turn-helix domain-containing protein, partial [Lachnospiraceae bacterium]|nr:helix-turn-helix domain-containing protein [Lachnospiraceae bacterium]